MWTAEGKAAGQRFGWSSSCAGGSRPNQTFEVLVGSSPMATVTADPVRLISPGGATVRRDAGFGTDEGTTVASIDRNGGGFVDDLIVEPSTGTIYGHDSAVSSGPLGT